MAAIPQISASSVVERKDANNPPRGCIENLLGRTAYNLAAALGPIPIAQLSQPGVSQYGTHCTQPQLSGKPELSLPTVQQALAVVLLPAMQDPNRENENSSYQRIFSSCKNNAIEQSLADDLAIHSRELLGEVLGKTKALKRFPASGDIFCFLSNGLKKLNKDGKRNDLDALTLIFNSCDYGIFRAGVFILLEDLGVRNHVDQLKYFDRLIKIDNESAETPECIKAECLEGLKTLFFDIQSTIQDEIDTLQAKQRNEEKAIEFLANELYHELCMPAQEKPNADRGPTNPSNQIPKRLKLNFSKNRPAKPIG